MQSKSRDHYMFAREQDDRERGCPKEAIQDVFRQLANMLPTQQHRWDSLDNVIPINNFVISSTVAKTTSLI